MLDDNYGHLYVWRPTPDDDPQGENLPSDYDPYPWRATPEQRAAVDAELDIIEAACRRITALGGAPPLFFADDPVGLDVAPSSDRLGC
jgi:hypothetical protein